MRRKGREKKKEKIDNGLRWSREGQHCKVDVILRVNDNT